MQNMKIAAPLSHIEIVTGSNERVQIVDLTIIPNSERRELGLI